MNSSPEFFKKINNIRLESMKNRKRTIFIDHDVPSVEEIDDVLAKLTWKTFTKLQKIKKLNEYIKIHDLNLVVITIDNACEYNIKNISFDSKIQRITNVNIMRKKN